MTKNEYLQEILKGKVYSHGILNAALVFWHSGIPINHAHEYIINYARKVNGSANSGSNNRGMR